MLKKKKKGLTSQQKYFEGNNTLFCNHGMSVHLLQR